MLNNIGPNFEIVNSGSVSDSLEPSIISSAISEYDFSKSVLNAGTGTLIDEKGLNPLTFTYNVNFTTVTSQGLDGIAIEQTSLITAPDEYTIAYFIQPHSLGNFSGRFFESDAPPYINSIDIGQGLQNLFPSDLTTNARRRIQTPFHEFVCMSFRSSGGYFCMSDYNHYMLYRPTEGSYPSGGFNIGLSNVNGLIVWAAIIPKFIDNANDAYIIKEYAKNVARKKGLTVNI